MRQRGDARKAQANASGMQVNSSKRKTISSEEQVNSSGRELTIALRTLISQGRTPVGSRGGRARAGSGGGGGGGFGFGYGGGGDGGGGGGAGDATEQDFWSPLSFLPAVRFAFVSWAPCLLGLRNKANRAHGTAPPPPTPNEQEEDLLKLRHRPLSTARRRSKRFVGERQYLITVISGRRQLGSP
ncbi:WAS/WASL-interacting protein family member 1-like [Penaeus indicus]|uniref:WAS/WASL-interacting protein family member 1-like n=1 Tax=Penaeus indicus TaxID=29960 RepID=UPI00300C041A